MAQARAELRLTLRRGDPVLLNLAIPIGLLAFFSAVKVLPLPPGTRHPVDFLAPGVVALAVMSAAMVSLGIGTGFERQHGVLKRLGATPLGRPRLLGAKMASVGAVEVLQVAGLIAVAFGFGWRPSGEAALAVAAALVGTAAFAGIGLLMAGTLKAEVTLALANAIYLALLLVGGIVFPISRLPAGLRTLAQYLPAGALSDALHGSLSAAGAVSLHSWIALGAWAIAAPSAAALLFRWE
jgi:ABC-2 type transport system permease protein